VHALLTKALTDAQRRGIVSTNVAQVAERPATSRSERRAWTIEEARRFLGVAAGDRLGAIYRLMLAIGIRREALGLTWRVHARRVRAPRRRRATRRGRRDRSRFRRVGCDVPEILGG
jgi:hypothetical protein